MVKNGTAESQVVIEGQEWLVSSGTDGELRYTVKVRDSKCGCNLRCNWCKVCPDNYTCTCEDYLHYGRASACKHIHLIRTERPLPEIQPGTQNEVDLANPDQNEFWWDPMVGPGVSATQFLPQRNQDAPDSATLRSEWLRFGEMIDKFGSPEAVASLVTKMKEIHHLGEIFLQRQEQPQAHFEVVQAVHGAQNAEKQRRFPRRQKRQTARAKQTNAADLRRMLNGVTEDHCAHCFRDNDNTNLETISWTQCSSCELWYHDACIDKPDEDAPFICANCDNRGDHPFRQSRNPEDGDGSESSDEDIDQPGFSGHSAPKPSMAARPSCTKKRAAEQPSSGNSDKRHKTSQRGIIRVPMHHERLATQQHIIQAIHADRMPDTFFVPPTPSTNPTIPSPPAPLVQICGSHPIEVPPEIQLPPQNNAPNCSFRERSESIDSGVSWTIYPN